jgi:hypothetical protein
MEEKIHQLEAFEDSLGPPKAIDVKRIPKFHVLNESDLAELDMKSCSEAKVKEIKKKYQNTYTTKFKGKHEDVLIFFQSLHKDISRHFLLPIDIYDIIQDRYNPHYFNQCIEPVLEDNEMSVALRKIVKNEAKIVPTSKSWTKMGQMNFGRNDLVEDVDKMKILMRHAKPDISEEKRNEKIFDKMYPKLLPSIRNWIDGELKRYLLRESDKDEPYEYLLSRLSDYAVANRTESMFPPKPTQSIARSIYNVNQSPIEEEEENLERVPTYIPDLEAQKAERDTFRVNQLEAQKAEQDNYRVNQIAHEVAALSQQQRYQQAYAAAPIPAYAGQIPMQQYMTPVTTYQAPPPPPLPATTYLPPPGYAPNRQSNPPQHNRPPPAPFQHQQRPSRPQAYRQPNAQQQQWQPTPFVLDRPNPGSKDHVELFHYNNPRFDMANEDLKNTKFRTPKNYVAAASRNHSNQLNTTPQLFAPHTGEHGYPTYANGSYKPVTAETINRFYSHLAIKY